MKKINLFLVLAGSFALTAKPARADDSAAPGQGFAASRYEVLWTKSPFSVATAEAVPESPDYSLVGFYTIDGTSYASLIERQNNEHFLVSTDKPIRGLTLTSITRGPASADTYALVQKDGQPITLKLEQAPVAPAGALNIVTPNANGAAVTIPTPGVMTPQITMPGSGTPASTLPTRPMIRTHRPTIHLPPAPAQQEQQVHPAPPSQ